MSEQQTVSETLETRGHLMDTGILASVLDDVLSYGGDYRIDRLDVGRAHEDESYARILVSHDDEESLHERIKVAERRMLVESVGRMVREGFTVTNRKVRFGR